MGQLTTYVRHGMRGPETIKHQLGRLRDMMRYDEFQRVTGVVVAVSTWILVDLVDLFVCLFACLFLCLFVCLFVCLVMF